MPSMKKPILIKTFRSMNTKPQTPKKGTVYFVEPIQSMTNDPTIKGDVFKKFVNGKLVKQIFVSKNRMKKIIKTAKKSEKKHGGRIRQTQKMRKIQKIPRRIPRRRSQKMFQPPVQQPVQQQVQQPVYVDQQVPQGQVPAQQIYAADNTTMAQAAKQGLAGGVAFFAAEALVGGVVDAFTGND